MTDGPRRFADIRSDLHDISYANAFRKKLLKSVLFDHANH